jgi:para-nitrobenzyl esterase
MQPPGMSLANGGDPGPLSEDCLYLNVWTPKVDPAARIPVLVWIHGGAYLFGSANLTIYNGQSLSTRGTVFVRITADLALLDFFAIRSRT